MRDGYWHLTCIIQLEAKQKEMGRQVFKMENQVVSDSLCSDFSRFIFSIVPTLELHIFIFLCIYT